MSCFCYLSHYTDVLKNLCTLDLSGEGGGFARLYASYFVHGRRNTFAHSALNRIAGDNLFAIPFDSELGEY